MSRVDDLFIVHRARSGLFEEYDPGTVAYVSNGSDTNGVLGFVKPLDGDAVFTFTGIVINAFSRTPGSCGARVQTPPFIACGRSGNGLLVLESKASMSVAALAYYAAFINRAHGWRFTWYRQATKDRFSGLRIPDKPIETALPIKDLMPARRAATIPLESLRFAPVPLDRLFELKPGDYHAESDLSPGSFPLVSCGDEDNGVIAYVDVPAEDLYCDRLTIALNGRPLTAKFHSYRFAAKDDVAVVLPRNATRVSTLLFVQMMLNRERWRYSYYRKCFIEKLRRFELALPVDRSGMLDEAAMARVIESTEYWPFLKKRLLAA